MRRTDGWDTNEVAGGSYNIQLLAEGFGDRSATDIISHF